MLLVRLRRVRICIERQVVGVRSARFWSIPYKKFYWGAFDAISQAQSQKGLSGVPFDAFFFQIYQRGLALVQQSDRAKMASQFLKQITKLSLQLEDYKGALVSIREEIEKFVEIRVRNRSIKRGGA